jgi:hypothetical protein
VTLFIYEIKLRFVLYKNMNISVHRRTRFDDLIFYKISLICLQSVVEEGLRAFVRASLLKKLILKKILYFL